MEVRLGKWVERHPRLFGLLCALALGMVALSSHWVSPVSPYSHGPVIHRTLR